MRATFPIRRTCPSASSAAYITTHIRRTLLSRRPDIVEQYGAFNAMLLNEKDYVATRAAHKLGPHRSRAQHPHRVLDVARRHLPGRAESARRPVRHRARRRRLAHAFRHAAATSIKRAACCRTTEMPRRSTRRASGTVFSDGAGVVVLKRLSDALSAIATRSTRSFAASRSTTTARTRRASRRRAWTDRRR